MSLTISIEQASSRLGELIRALGPYDEIVLTENDKQVARIVPDAFPKKRTLGVWKGMLTILSEDDEHLEDFKEYIP